jgi:hypothetical protein
VSGLEIRDQISSSSVNELLLDVLLLLRANTATPDFFVSIVKEVVFPDAAQWLKNWSILIRKHVKLGVS